jgi:hypothetical protein
MIEDTVRHGENLGDFGAQAFALNCSLLLFPICGRIDAALDRAEALATLAAEKGTALWALNARATASWARGRLGQAGRHWGTAATHRPPQPALPRRVFGGPHDQVTPLCRCRGLDHLGIAVLNHKLDFVFAPPDDGNFVPLSM